MKESGIDWIGQIPEEWEVSKLEHYVDIFGRIGFRGYTTNDIVNEGEGAISYSPSNIIDYSVIDNNNTYISWSKYDESPEIQIKTGDILYVKTGSSYGKTGIVNKLSNKATINPQLVVLKPKKNTDSRLINYFLNSSVGKEQSELIVGGSTIPTITQESIKKMIFPKISFEEQQKIADFLDKKTAQLNKVKNLLEEQIQKLKDYRASLIYETVTKGLDKTVPMKDSGIDWIGQVPEGWKIGRVKDAFKLRSEKNFRPIEEVQLLSLYTEFGVFPHGDREEKGNKAVSTEGYKIVYKKDIVVNIILAWMGSIGISEYDGVTSPAYDIYEPLEGVCSKFFHYLFRTEAFAGQCYKYGKGIMKMRWRTYSDDFKTIEIPIPDYNSQVNIVKFLDNKLKIINQLIDIKQEQIENINKQRQTLIYNYVTGKRRGKEI